MGPLTALKPVANEALDTAAALSLLVAPLKIGLDLAFSGIDPAKTGREEPITKAAFGVSRAFFTAGAEDLLKSVGGTFTNAVGL